MSVYLCHEQPDLLVFESSVLNTRAGAILLSRSALHPGGGGQVSDRATVKHQHGIANIVSVSLESDGYWHLLDQPIELNGTVEVCIDADHRSRVSQLHTDTHILNALVYQSFAGALVTGCQINGNGVARMDFDLPEADNERLRALEPAVNEIIRRGVDVRALYVSTEEARATPGLVRSMSVAPPPTPDGRLRVIDIADVDRQACGGTHLSNTAQSGLIRITKIENKGRHNRRIRIALV